MQWFAIASIIVFTVTLFLIIKRPKNLNIGISAGLGAIASLVIGTVTVSQALESLGYIWDGALAFLGIIILSISLDAMGFFRWAANKVIKIAKGNGIRLYFYITLLAATVSVLFSNDSAVLILTPIVAESVNQLNFSRENKLPFLFAAGLVSDTAAMPLITSNPVNIVNADFFGYTFIDHVIFMGPTALMTIFISLFLVFFFFRKKIPKHYSLEEEFEGVNKKPLISSLRFKIIIITLITIDLGYIITSLFRIPVSFVIISGAVFLLFIYWMTGKNQNKTENVDKSLSNMMKEVNWGIILFMVGIFIVVQGLRQAGVMDFFSDIFVNIQVLPSFLSLLLSSLIITISASVINNWPMTLLGMISIKQAIVTSSLTSASSTGLIFSNIIGNNLGPHFFPLGSLAILIWLDTMKRKGISIKIREYLKIGALLSILEVLAATFILWIQIDLLQFVLPFII